MLIQILHLKHLFIYFEFDLLTTISNINPDNVFKISTPSDSIYKLLLTDSHKLRKLVKIS